MKITLPCTNLSIDWPTSSSQQPSSRSLPSSSLSSLEKSSWTQLVYSFFEPIVRLIRWLLCCPYAPPKNVDQNPEIDPSTLSIFDPFRKKMFTSSLGFKSEKAFQATVDLFQKLGTYSYTQWIWHRAELSEKEKTLREIAPHPLEFLYFLFCNKTMTSYIVQFQKEAATGKFILSLKTGRSPWEEFIQKNGKNFQAHAGDIPPLMPGFCKALGLNEQALTPFIKQQEWEKLISEIFHQRKKHFKL